MNPPAKAPGGRPEEPVTHRAFPKSTTKTHLFHHPEVVKQSLVRFHSTLIASPIIHRRILCGRPEANGKVECNPRTDHEEFYRCITFCTPQQLTRLLRRWEHENRPTYQPVAPNP